MYGKIIRKNIRKNFRDYGIYFFTLFLSVGVFYAFNSIESQSAFKQMVANGNGISAQIISLTSIVSKFIAVMLAFLILYANNFLLKRRKKEMGIYMILGMSPNKISSLFTGETLLIGSMALAGGIGLGCVMSQGISLIALKLFKFDLASYRFTFSVNSFKETVICFAIIYAFVVFLNVGTIKKVKLIDMINAERKNETVIINKRIYQVLILIGAGVLYVLAGYLAQNGRALNPTSKQSGIAIISVCLATAMMLYSGTSIAFDILKKNKTWYLKNINTFIVRQLNSKLQSNYITMTVVSLLLTGTICIISVGIGMADSMNKTAEGATPYDVLILKDEEGYNDSEQDLINELQTKGVDVDNVIASKAIFKMYKSDDLLYKDIVSDVDKLPAIDESLPNSTVDIIKISDYNNAMALQGKEQLELKAGCYYINCNYKATDSLVEKKLKEQCDINVGGTVLSPATDEVMHNCYYMTAVGINDHGTIIIPDEVAEGLTATGILLVGNYEEGYDAAEFEKNIVTLMGDAVDSPINYMTKDLICESYYGMFAILSFICSYIGIILLIICVAVLSLQQLTETSDNVMRYNILHKIGVDKKSCTNALFKQIMVYFGVPLVVGMAYSAIVLPKVAVKVQNSLGMHIGTQIAYIFAMLVAIYGSYFVLTFLSCKKMINEKR